MKARARFYNRQIDTCEVQVEDGEVRVWDPIPLAFPRGTEPSWARPVAPK